MQFTFLFLSCCIGFLLLLKFDAHFQILFLHNEIKVSYGKCSNTFVRRYILLISGLRAIYLTDEEKFPISQ